MVKTYGGNSIGVYDPDVKNDQKVQKIFDEGRLSFFAPADYTKTGILYNKICSIIDEKGEDKK